MLAAIPPIALDRREEWPIAAVGRSDDKNWDTMADELVELVASYLVPGTLESPWLSLPLGKVSDYYAEESVGAAHWLQLSKALARRAQRWQISLRHARRCRDETRACCRVLECRNEAAYDWPLEVLRLRASRLSGEEAPPLLTHQVPMPRQALRTAYWAVAKEVHPDRLQTPLATQAMVVLNEAYRQAVIHFAERDQQEIIRLDALGLEHVHI